MIRWGFAMFSGQTRRFLSTLATTFTNGVLAAVAMALPPSSAYAQEELWLGVDGLGGITAATPFDSVYLKASFPDFRWEPEDRQLESGFEQVLHASKHGQRWFSLVSDGGGRIASIRVGSPSVRNWLGPRVGDPFGTLQRNHQLGDCSAGQEALSGKVVCSAMEADQISYVFAGSWDGPDGELPPSEVLDDWVVSGISWRPARTAETAVAPFGPSFDCTKATGSIEGSICNDVELSELDQRLSAFFTSVLKNTNRNDQENLRTMQRRWIRARNDCWKSATSRSCILETYRSRIAELEASAGAFGPSKLGGTAWSGVRIAGDMIPSEIDITLTFGADGRLDGSAGCNRYSGDYEQNGADLMLGSIGTTRKTCLELTMVAERRFLAALESTTGWAMKDGQLILFGSGAELSFAQAG